MAAKKKAATRKKTAPKKVTAKKAVARKKAATRKKNPDQPRYVIWTYARKGNMPLKKRYIHHFGVHESVSTHLQDAEVFTEKGANEVLLEMYRRWPRDHHGFQAVKK